MEEPFSSYYETSLDDKNISPSDRECIERARKVHIRANEIKSETKWHIFLYVLATVLMIVMLFSAVGALAGVGYPDAAIYFACAVVVLILILCCIG